MGLAALTRYELIGAREDLTNKLIQVGDESATLFSQIKLQTVAKQQTHEWQDYSLPTPTENAQIDGFTPTVSAIVRTRNQNQIQIFSQGFEVSNTVLEGMDIAGVANEMSFQADGYFKAMHRDIEWALINNVVSGITGTSGTSGSKLLGVFGAIQTNVASPISASSVLLEDDFLNAIQSIFDQTGEKYGNLKAIASSGQTKAIMGFTGTGKTQFVTDKSNVHNRLVTLVLTNFGNVEIIPNTQTTGLGSLAILNMDYWAIAWKRPIKMIPLATTKDAKSAYWVCECTLEWLKERANALVTGLVY